MNENNWGNNENKLKFHETISNSMKFNFDGEVRNSINTLASRHEGLFSIISEYNFEISSNSILPKLKKNQFLC